MKFYTIIEIFILISATVYSVSCQNTCSLTGCQNGGTFNSATCSCICAIGYSGYDCRYGKTKFVLLTTEKI